jgi:hypothetical protein
LSAITAGLRGIVFRNSGLDLADQVGAHIRALGEDAAAETREDRDQRAAEAQADERMNDVAEVRPVVRVRIKKQEEARDAEKAEPDHEQAGDRAAVERHLQRFVEADPRGFRGAHVRAHRDIHADDAAQSREHRADQEAECGRPAELGMKPISRKRNKPT